MEYSGAVQGSLGWRLTSVSLAQRWCTHTGVNEMVQGSYVQWGRNGTWIKGLWEHHPVNRRQKKRSVRRLQEGLADCSRS